MEVIEMDEVSAAYGRKEKSRAEGIKLKRTHTHETSITQHVIIRSDQKGRVKIGRGVPH
jgi:hypothetical protein